ncbi:DUF6445 family protein [Brevundimonas sp.]|uniref:DUF6445 family protein n=1 Tax=Brevundimonas sp. TaxID=1871086 RepID=UPI00351D8237
MPSGGVEGAADGGISSAFPSWPWRRHGPCLEALQTDFARHGEPAAGYIEGDTAIFSRIAYFTPTYNRTLIYRSSLLHCASVAGDAALPADVHAGRLTIATFLSAR